MKVIIFGATGMVGSGVLRECLDDPHVASILVVGRSRSGVTHPKLRELLISDFFDYSKVRGELTGHDACFFCLGVSAAGKTEAEYTHLTYDLTMAAGQALASLNPGMTFCYVSGEGTDSTERGRFMWARVKGRTENALQRLPFRAVMFRPGYIQPMKGVRSTIRLYQAVHLVITPLFPIVRRVVPTHVTTTVNVGRAMIGVTINRFSKQVLENVDINRLAAG